MRRKIVKKFAIGLLSCSMLISVAQPAFAAPTTSELEQQSQELAEEIAGLDEELVDVLAEIELTKTEIEETQKKVDQAAEELKAAEADRDQQYENLKVRIQYTYESGKESQLEALLQSDSFAETVNKTQYFKDLYTSDQELLDKYQKAVDRVKTQKEKLEQEQARLEDQKADLEAQNQELETQLSDKKQEKESIDREIAAAKMKAAYVTQASATGKETDVYYTLREKGYTLEAACGIMGNIYQETGFRNNYDSYKGSEGCEGYGFFSITDGRANSMREYCSDNYGDEYSIVGELEYMDQFDFPEQLRLYSGKQPHYYSTGEWCWWPETVTIEEFKALTDVDQATEIFERVYERAGKPNIEKRKAMAQVYAERYADWPDTREEYESNTELGQQIVDYAVQFEGNKYVFGGTDLYNGIDCSGFVMRVYEHFGYTGLPHSSAALRSVGTEVSVSDMQPGDIVCYSGHVGIYAGDGQIINASNSAPYPRGGIKFSSVYMKEILSVRRLV